MKRFAKIICTLGPVSNNEAMISKMIDRGMNVVRINLSHGDRKMHQEMINNVRKVAKKKHADIKILLDLEGYRIRLGKFKKTKVLEQNKIWYVSNEESNANNYIPFDYEGPIKNIEKGSNIFINDGNICLRVLSNTGKQLKCKVIQGGKLTERKGVNIPKLKLQSNIMTDKDKEGIDFAIKNQVDMVSQSFVRNKKDVSRVIGLIKSEWPDCQVIAKIESEEGVKNIEGIIESCDGVMVARGDLGVTLPIYKIPVLQKFIISLCNRQKKISITATQMLDSMIEQGRPTRAEVTDVANAIFDGTDYVMLSGETAVGKFPSRCVKLMSQIVAYTEKYKYFHPKA